jgi:hypothetical protein
MAAGQGFKTFTTGEVLTAADTNGYLMQGVLVFADAAARNAAITSPQEGQTSYLKDTDEIQVYSGSVWVTKSGSLPSQTGNSGKYLTTDGTTASWDTIAAGGMTLLSTTTLTGASVTLSSISGSYKNLQLVIENFKPATDTTALRLRINGDSGANRYFQTNTSTSDNGGGTLAFDDTSMGISATNDNSVANGLSVLNFYDYTNATTWKILDFRGVTVDTTTTTSFKMYNGNGVYNQTAAITSLVLFPTTGNFTSGTALLYGVK